MKCPECKGKIPLRISADDVRAGASIFSSKDLFPTFLLLLDLIIEKMVESKNYIESYEE